MKNLSKTNKTVLLSSLFAVLILSLGSISTAQAQELTDAEKLDQVGKALLMLQIQNEQLKEITGIPSITAMTVGNDQKIATLQVELDNIIPKSPLAKIDPATEAKMNDAFDRLLESDFPLLGFGINSKTGVFDIEVDSDRSGNIDKELQKFVGERVPIDVTYGIYDATLQGSCVGQTGYCSTIIGASKSEANHINDIDCTISIPSTKGSGGSLVNGVIIPHHCNVNHVDYYQSVKTIGFHKVGPHNTDGGFYCDCDFVKINSRSFDTAKINYGGSDVSVAGREDFSVNDTVYMIGQFSGLDFGTIEKINQAKWLEGGWRTNLYWVSGISYDTGDSGAPIMKTSNSKYGGMNIAAGSETVDGIPNTPVNYVHDWTHMKSKLGLN